MIKSMTGFASLTREDERGTLGLTVRAVNHRFLDLQIRLPQTLADLEPRIRPLLQKRLGRGRIELAVSLQLRQGLAPQVELQEEFARAVAAAIDVARERGLVKGDLTPGDLLRMPQAFTIRERAGDTETLGEVFGAAVESAVDAAIERARDDARPRGRTPRRGSGGATRVVSGPDRGPCGGSGVGS